MEVEQLFIYKRIQERPLLFRSYIKRLNGSIKFCKDVVKFDNYLYFYLPKDLQLNNEIIDVVLNNASTLNIDFPFDKLCISNEIQLSKLKTIFITKYYIKLYENIYGVSIHNIKDFYFNDEEIVNKFFAYVNGLINGLSDDEKYIIVLKYGLNDGIKKGNKDMSHFFNCNPRDVNRYIEQILRKIRSFVYNNQNNEELSSSWHYVI